MQQGNQRLVGRIVVNYLDGLLARWRRSVAMSGGLACLACTLTSCAFYRAQPLNEAVVNQALQPLPLESVKIAVAKLDHLLLKPMLIVGQDGYTPDEIGVIAVVLSPQLRAVRDQHGLAQAQVVQAGILPNPQLSRSVDVPSGNATAAQVGTGLVKGRNSGLSWDLSALLSHRDDIAAARANAQSVDLQIAWQEWQVAQDARLRAFRIASLEQRLPLAREIETGLIDNVAAIRQAFSLGHRITADLTAATDLLSQAQTRRLSLEQSLIADRLQLNLALGQSAESTVHIKVPEDFPALEADTSASAQLLHGLETHRLDLVALRMGYQSQEHALRSAVWSQFPKIGLSFNRASDTSGIKTRGAAVGIELPLFDRRQGAVAIARATRQQLFDEYVLRVAEARASVHQTLEDLAVTRVQLTTVTASLTDLQQLASAYDRAFSSQNADVIAYRDARAALATRRIEQYQLKQDLLELGVALEIASGRGLLSRTITRTPAT